MKKRYRTLDLMNNNSELNYWFNNAISAKKYLINYYLNNKKDEMSMGIVDSNKGIVIFELYNLSLNPPTIAG